MLVGGLSGSGSRVDAEIRLPFHTPMIAQSCDSSDLASVVLDGVVSLGDDRNDSESCIVDQ